MARFEEQVVDRAAGSLDDDLEAAVERARLIPVSGGNIGTG